MSHVLLPFQTSPGTHKLSAGSGEPGDSGQSSAPAPGMIQTGRSPRRESCPGRKQHAPAQQPAPTPYSDPGPAPAQRPGEIRAAGFRTRLTTRVSGLERGPRRADGRRRERILPAHPTAEPVEPVEPTRPPKDPREVAAEHHQPPPSAWVSSSVCGVYEGEVEGKGGCRARGAALHTG